MTATTWEAFPAFPPLDDALAAIAAIDWRQVLTVCLFALAISQAIATRSLPHLARFFRFIACKLDAIATRSEIRRLSAAGCSQRALAARFGVTRYAIRQALA